MADDRITAAASLFAQAWLDGTVIDAFPNDPAPRDRAEAMALQDAMAARIGEDTVGWKIGEICGSSAVLARRRTLFGTVTTGPGGESPAAPNGFAPRALAASRSRSGRSRPE